MLSPTPQTPFTRDVVRNYVCNLFAEAQSSGPFDLVIIGGGTFVKVDCVPGELLAMRSPVVGRPAA
jgi:hypothetical protein